MKNKFMRIAAVMLMLCLVTTCAISGTFAKYTTEGTATDTARVAKWGITVSAPTDPAASADFKTAYASETVGFTANTVVSSDTDNIIAPGTKGTFATPVLSGEAEVAVEVIVTAEIVIDGWSVTSGEYFPIVFTVGTETYGTNITAASNKFATAAEVISAVQTAVTKTTNYEANTDATTFEVPVVEWEWAFEVDNAMDTELGTAADDGHAATIEYTITVTINQIN